MTQSSESRTGVELWSDVSIDMMRCLAFLSQDPKARKIIFGNIMSAVAFSFMWLLQHNGMQKAWSSGHFAIDKGEYEGVL